MTVPLTQFRVTLRIDFPEKIEKVQATKLFRQIDSYTRTALKSGTRTDSSTSSVTIAGVLLDEAEILVTALRMLVEKL